MTKLSKAKVRKAIPGSMGTRSIIARRCGVSRSALTQFLQKSLNKDVSSEIELEGERVLDLAEGSLFNAVKEEKAWAIRLVLKKLGASRGYS